MNLELKGKVAIVTGGSRGIGRAVCERFLGEGASVVVSSLRAESVTAAVGQLGSAGPVEGIACDVTREEEVTRLVAETVKRLGRVDVMVANAGVADTEMNLADMPVAEWDRMLAVHMRGTFLCGREAARAMRSASIPGRIVNVSSTSAFEGDPSFGHYSAAKAGIIGLTRSMAIDFAIWGIRVNCIAPGWVHTDMTASDLPRPGTPIKNLGILDRAGKPEEVAAAIAFLASDICDFMTGATLVVDGGQLVMAPKIGW